VLGVKKQETAFWGHTKDKRAAEWLLFFAKRDRKGCREKECL